LVDEKIKSEQTQKTNLEEKSHHKHHSAKKHKKAKKHHKKAHHQKSVNSLVETEESKTVKPEQKEMLSVKVEIAAPAAKPIASKAKPAPASKNLLATKLTNQDEFDKFAQNVDVPIDELKAITLKVAPTYNLDQVESVTLKSFRKVVGYDTFNSILKGDRNEKKDISDHYNVTVSMMVRRIPAE